MTKAEENVTKKHLLQFALHNSYTGSWLIFILAQFEGHMVDLVVAPTFLAPVLIDLQMSTDLRSPTCCCYDTSV